MGAGAALRDEEAAGFPFMWTSRSASYAVSPRGNGSSGMQRGREPHSRLRQTA